MVWKTSYSPASQNGAMFGAASVSSWRCNATWANISCAAACEVGGIFWAIKMVCHMLHVWNYLTYIYLKVKPNVGKSYVNIPYMEHLRGFVFGASQLEFETLRSVLGGGGSGNSTNWPFGPINHVSLSSSRQLDGFLMSLQFTVCTVYSSGLGLHVCWGDTHIRMNLLTYLWISICTAIIFHQPACCC